MIDTSKQVKNITYNGTPLTLYQEEINLQDKSITINSNGTQNISADTGYDGLGNVSVTVNVASSGSSILDDYIVAYKTYSTQLSANTIGLSFETRYDKGVSGDYIYFISPFAEVGQNVIDNLIRNSSTSSKNKYYFGFYYTGTSYPTLENLKASTDFGYIGLYKYNSVSANQSSLDMGDLVLFDNDGVILAKNSWEQVLLSLNNKTIDISNGIYFGSTKVPSASSTTNNRTSLNFT